MLLGGLKVFQRLLCVLIIDGDGNPLIAFGHFGEYSARAPVMAALMTAAVCSHKQATQDRNHLTSQNCSSGTDGAVNYCQEEKVTTMPFLEGLIQAMPPLKPFC